MLKKYSDEDVFQLVKKVRRGNTDAMGELADTYEKFVFGTVLSEIKNREDAETLTEDIFAEAYINIALFNKDTSFGAWLYSIIEKHIDMYKKKNGISREATGEAPGAASDKRSSLMIDSSSKVVKMINSLEPELRVAVTYRDLMGLTYLEISDLTEVTASTAKSRVTAGRERVKAEIEEYLASENITENIKF